MIRKNWLRLTSSSWWSSKRKEFMHRRKQQHRRAGFRPRMEALEVRVALAVAIWTGLGADRNWSTAANWQGSMSPTAGDDLAFTSSTTFSGRTNTNNFTSGTSFRSLAFTQSSFGYTINGNPISLGVGGITSDYGGQINLDIALAADQTFTVNNHQLTINGSLSETGGSHSLMTAGGGTYPNLAFSGSTSNTYTGTTTVVSGTLTLSGSSTYAGGTTILGGILRALNTAALGTVGTVTVGNPSLTQATLDIPNGEYFSGKTLVLNGSGFNDTGAMRGSGGWTRPVVLNWEVNVTVDAGSSLRTPDLSGKLGGRFLGFLASDQGVR